MSVFKKITDAILDFKKIDVVFENIHLSKNAYMKFVGEMPCNFHNFKEPYPENIMDKIQIHDMVLNVISENKGFIWFTQNAKYANGMLLNEPKIGYLSGDIEMLIKISE